jgi:hypothetical protein
MHAGRVDSSGDDLHRFPASSESPNILQIRPGGKNHFLPSKRHFFRQRLGERTVRIDRHFGDAVLGRSYAALVRAQSKLLPDRGLNARSIKDLKANAVLVGPRMRSDLETYNNVEDKTQTVP